MLDIWSLTTASLVPSAVIGLMGYFGKLAIDRRLARIDEQTERLGTMAGELRSASLGVKGKLREEERQAVVDVRVALERWEDFLHNAPFDYGMAAANTVDLAAFYAKDRETFLAVRLALVKAAVYLRDPTLENRLMHAIIDIRKILYPVLNTGLRQVAVLQVQRRPLAQKFAAFEKNADAALAPAAADYERDKALDDQITTALSSFAAATTQAYTQIAPQLAELKAAINS